MESKKQGTDIKTPPTMGQAKKDVNPPQQQQQKVGKIQDKTWGMREKLVANGREAEEVLWRLVTRDEDMWSVEDGDAKSGIFVSSRYFKWPPAPSSADTPPGDNESSSSSDDDDDQGGSDRDDSKERKKPSKTSSSKIWKCCGVVDAMPEQVMHLLRNIDGMTKWNDEVKQYQLVRQVDADTDIVHCTSGTRRIVVNARDFVILRHYHKRENDTHLLSTIGVPPEVEFIPSAESVVRGMHGPGGFFMKPARNQPKSTWVCWVLNIDPRGWLPRFLVNKAAKLVLIEWMNNLRKTLAKLPKLPPPLPPPKPTQPQSSTTKPLPTKPTQPIAPKPTQSQPIAAPPNPTIVQKPQQIVVRKVTPIRA